MLASYLGEEEEEEEYQQQQQLDAWGPVAGVCYLQKINIHIAVLEFPAVTVFFFLSFSFLHSISL